MMIYLKRDIKTNGDPYYKYILCYVYDFLRVYFKPKEDMDSLNMIYRLKEGFGTPDWYLGTTVDKVHLKDRLVAWSTDCVGYLKREIENVDN